MENTANIQSGSKSCQCCKVDYTLLPLKVFNFFYFGAVGSVIPFLTVYLKHLGLTAPETGFITGCAVLLASLVRPLLGLLADTVRARRGLLLLCCLLFGAAFSSLWFLPKRTVSNTTTPAWSCTHTLADTHACTRLPEEQCRAVDCDTEDAYNTIILFPQSQLREKVTNLSLEYDSLNEQYFCTKKLNRSHYQGENVVLEATIRQDYSSSGNQEEDGSEKNIAMKDSETVASTNSSTWEEKMTFEVSAGELILDVYAAAQNRLFLKLRERPGDHRMRETIRKLARVDLNIACSLVRKGQEAAGVSSFPDDALTAGSLPGKQSYNDILQHTSLRSRQTGGSYEREMPVLTTSTFREEQAQGDDGGFEGSAKTSGKPLEIASLPRDSSNIQHAEPNFGEQALVTTCNSSTPRSAGSRCRCRVFACKAWQVKGDNSPAFTADLVFGMTLFLMAVARAFYSSSSSLLDAVTYTMLNANRHHWGRQRMWGTVGTATAATVIMGANVAIAGDSFGNLFLTGFCLVILTCITGLFLKRQSATTATTRAKGFGEVQAVLRKMSVLVFLCKILFFGILCGSVQNFAFWFLRELGAGQTVLGACLLANCLSSVVVLRCAAVVLRRVGETRTMYLVLPVYTLRFVGISVLQNPWLAVPLELLHGWTYSLLWAASSASTHLLAPSGGQATCQGIAGAIYWDLGRGVGSLLTGYLFRALGARWTFRLYGAASIVFLPVFFVLDWQWPSARSQPADVETKGQELLLASSDSPEAPPVNGLAIKTVSPSAASQCQQDTDTPSDITGTRFVDQSHLTASDEVCTVTAKPT